MDRRRPCSGLWETPTVSVDGDLTTCCLDQHLDNRLGNLRERSLDDLWHAEEIERWRLAQVEDRYDASGPYCGRCNWRSAGAMPHHKVLQWLEQQGHKRAARRYRQRWGLDSD